jgi:cation diffusion facilitator CzcD-associated flavoprotein CzcO
LNVANYDVVVIGAGLAGLSAAMAITNSSDTAVAILERRGVGRTIPRP